MAKKSITSKTAKRAAAPVSLQTVHIKLPVDLVGKARVAASQRGLRSLNAYLVELLTVATKGMKAPKAPRATTKAA
ncbi:MAG: hypothetical protein IPK75_20400 [Acidobacteria bacterium]|nr:hypothetical protein [Acidobacteriota bacterium]